MVGISPIGLIVGLNRPSGRFFFAFKVRYRRASKAWVPKRNLEIIELNSNSLQTTLRKFCE